MERGGGKGSGRGDGISSPGGTAEKAGDRVKFGSVTGAMEAKGDIERVASSRAN